MFIYIYMYMYVCICVHVYIYIYIDTICLDDVGACGFDGDCLWLFGKGRESEFRTYSAGSVACGSGCRSYTRRQLRWYSLEVFPTSCCP